MHNMEFQVPDMSKAPSDLMLRMNSMTGLGAEHNPLMSTDFIFGDKADAALPHFEREPQDEVAIVPLAAGSKPPVMGSSLDLDWGSRSSSLDQTPQLQYGLMQMKSPFAMPFQSSSLESAFTFAPAQPSSSSSGHKEVSNSGPAAPQHPMEQEEAPAGSSSGEDSDAEPEDDVDFDNSEEYASRKQESRATGMASRRSGRKRKAGPSEGVAKQRKKVGRPITYNGDPNSPNLTEEERRKVKRRIANRESARRVQQRRKEIIEDLQIKLQHEQSHYRQLMSHLATVEKEKEALGAQVEAAQSQWTRHVADNRRLVAEVQQLREQYERRHGHLPQLPTSSITTAAATAPLTTELLMPSNLAQPCAVAPSMSVAPGRPREVTVKIEPSRAPVVASQAAAPAEAPASQGTGPSKAASAAPDFSSLLLNSRPTVTSGASLQTNGPSLGPLASGMHSCAAASHHLLEMSATRMPSLNASMCLDDFLTAVIA